jgi:hypothetical protein
MMKAAISYQLLAISRFKNKPTKHLIAVKFVLTADSLQLTAGAF